MNLHGDTTESEDDKLTCSICLASIQDKDYGTTDHPDDSKMKCCVECVKQQIEKNRTSLISRKPIGSYSIYNKDGKFLKTVLVNQQLPDISIVIPNDNGNVHIHNPGNVIINPQPIVYQAPQQNRRYGNCTRPKMLNAVICGAIFVLGMTLFAVLYTIGTVDQKISFVIIGVSCGAVIVGMFIHGLLDCRDANNP